MMIDPAERARASVLASQAPSLARVSAVELERAQGRIGGLGYVDVGAGDDVFDQRSVAPQRRIKPAQRPRVNGARGDGRAWRRVTSTER
eukprot:3044595-Rhodomonas_salina.3